MLKGKKPTNIQKEKKKKICKVLNRLDGVERYVSVQACTDVKLALLHTASLQRALTVTRDGQTRELSPATVYCRCI